jgi:hypothetical protein
LPAARHGYHGLYLEMKSEMGSASLEQKDFLRGVLEEGYCVVIAYVVDQARVALEWYIGIINRGLCKLKLVIINSFLIGSGGARCI